MKVISKAKVVHLQQTPAGSVVVIETPAGAKLRIHLELAADDDPLAFEGVRFGDVFTVEITKASS